MSGVVLAFKQQRVFSGMASPVVGQDAQRNLPTARALWLYTDQFAVCPVGGVEYGRLCRTVLNMELPPVTFDPPEDISHSPVLRTHFGEAL